MSQVSNQSIYSLKVVSLKSLKNVEVDFQGKNVTAILGPNGHGKSTVLHALACVYSPLDQTKGEDYKFSDFFLPNTDAAWNNSSFTIDYTYREKDTVHDQLSKNYQKTEARWTPRYVNRPKREIYYIGIDTCVPMIESETKKSKVNYSTDVLQDAEINKVLEKHHIF